MEVDMEPLDLNNSSRIVSTTMELVDSLIFTNFYGEFLCISRDSYLTAPTEDIHVYISTWNALFTKSLSCSAIH